MEEEAKLLRNNLQKMNSKNDELQEEFFGTISDNFQAKIEKLTYKNTSLQGEVLQKEIDLIEKDKELKQISITETEWRQRYEEMQKIVNEMRERLQQTETDNNDLQSRLLDLDQESQSILSQELHSLAETGDSNIMKHSTSDAYSQTISILELVKEIKNEYKKKSNSKSPDCFEDTENEVSNLDNSTHSNSDSNSVRLLTKSKSYSPIDDAVCQSITLNRSGSGGKSSEFKDETLPPITNTDWNEESTLHACGEQPLSSNTVKFLQNEILGYQLIVEKLKLKNQELLERPDTAMIQDDNESLEREVSALRGQVALLERNNRVFSDTERNELKQELELANKRCNNYQAQLQALKASLEYDEVEKMKQLNKKNQMQMENLKKQLKEFQLAEETESEYESDVSRISHRQEKYARLLELEEEIADLKKKVEKKDEELKDRDKIKDESQHELQSIKSKHKEEIAKITKMNQEREKVLSEDIVELKRDVAECKDIVKLKQIKMKIKDKELEKCDDEIEKLEKNILTENKEISGLKWEFEVLQKENESLRKRVDAFKQATSTYSVPKFVHSLGVSFHSASDTSILSQPLSESMTSNPQLASELSGNPTESINQSSGSSFHNNYAIVDGNERVGRPQNRKILFNPTGESVTAALRESINEAKQTVHQMGNVLDTPRHSPTRSPLPQLSKGDQDCDRELPALHVDHNFHKANHNHLHKKEESDQTHENIIATSSMKSKKAKPKMSAKSSSNFATKIQPFPFIFEESKLNHHRSYSNKSVTCDKSQSSSDSNTYSDSSSFKNHIISDKSVAKINVGKNNELSNQSQQQPTNLLILPSTNEEQIIETTFFPVLSKRDTELGTLHKETLRVTSVDASGSSCKKHNSSVASDLPKSANRKSSSTNEASLHIKSEIKASLNQAQCETSSASDVGDADDSLETKIITQPYSSTVNVDIGKDNHDLAVQNSVNGSVEVIISQTNRVNDDKSSTTTKNSEKQIEENISYRNLQKENKLSPFGQHSTFNSADILQGPNSFLSSSPNLSDHAVLVQEMDKVREEAQKWFTELMQSDHEKRLLKRRLALLESEIVRLKAVDGGYELLKKHQNEMQKISLELDLVCRQTETANKKIEEAREKNAVLRAHFLDKQETEDQNKKSKNSTLPLKKIWFRKEKHGLQLPLCEVQKVVSKLPFTSKTKSSLTDKQLHDIKHSFEYIAANFADLVLKKHQAEFILIPQQVREKSSDVTDVDQVHSSNDDQAFSLTDLENTVAETGHYPYTGNDWPESKNIDCTNTKSRVEMNEDEKHKIGFSFSQRTSSSLLRSISASSSQSSFPPTTHRIYVAKHDYVPPSQLSSSSDRNGVSIADSLLPNLPLLVGDTVVAISSPDQTDDNKMYQLAEARGKIGFVPLANLIPADQVNGVQTLAEEREIVKRKRRATSSPEKMANLYKKLEQAHLLVAEKTHKERQSSVQYLPSSALVPANRWGSASLSLQKHSSFNQGYRETDAKQTSCLSGNSKNIFRKDSAEKVGLLIHQFTTMNTDDLPASGSSFVVEKSSAGENSSGRTENKSSTITRKSNEKSYRKYKQIAIENQHHEDSDINLLFPGQKTNEINRLSTRKNSNTPILKQRKQRRSSFLPPKRSSTSDYSLKSKDYSGRTITPPYFKRSVDGKKRSKCSSLEKSSLHNNRNLTGISALAVTAPQPPTYPVIEKTMGQKSMIISWTPPLLDMISRSNDLPVIGYELSINKQRRVQVSGAYTNKAILGDLNLTKSLIIDLRTVSSIGSLSPPCEVIYTPNSYVLSTLRRSSLPPDLARSLTSAAECTQFNEATIHHPEIHYATALYDYDPKVDSPYKTSPDEISLQQGEKVLLIGSPRPDGFCNVQARERCGIAPVAFLISDCDTTIDSRDGSSFSNHI